MIPRPLTQCTSKRHFEPFERKVLKLTFEIGLHLQEFQAQHLCVGDKWIGPAVSDPDRLVNEVVSLRRLLGYRVDGVLEDLPLSACYEPGC